VAYCLAADQPAWLPQLDQLLAAPLGPDRETWGATPDATRGAAAMEQLAGGPARPRT
jgi:hypothetical protein